MPSAAVVPAGSIDRAPATSAAAVGYMHVPGFGVPTTMISSKRPRGSGVTMILLPFAISISNLFLS